MYVLILYMYTYVSSAEDNRKAKTRTRGSSTYTDSRATFRPSVRPAVPRVT